jgi:hypothetical protein
MKPQKLFCLTFTTVIAVLLLNQTGRAQSTAGNNSSNPWHFDVGVETAVPTGDITYSSHFALGGSARLQYDLSDRVAIMLTSGYTNYFGRKYNDGPLRYDTKSYGLIPVKAGIKVFVIAQFYVSGEAGVGFATKNVINPYGPANKWLILSPGIGYAPKKSGIDIGLRYENYSGSEASNFGIVALRIAYKF